jgi:hypothetical protein
MSVPRARWELFGSVSGGADVWSTGFVGGDTSGLSGATLLTDAQNVYDAFNGGVWSQATSKFYWAPETTLEGCRVREIDGSNITTRVATYTAPSAVPGSSSADQLPAECAIVVSLLTATAGARGRGRMYLPCTALDTVVTNGVLDSAVVAQIVSGMAGFFTGLNSQGSTVFPGNVSMYSNSASALRTVTDIRCGNVVDSQRRRRNTQLESYSSASL